MNKRRYTLIVTEVNPQGTVYEGSIETDSIDAVKAYLGFYEEKTKIEEGEANGM